MLVNRNIRLVRRLWVGVLVAVVLLPVVFLLFAPDRGADGPLLLSLAAGYVAFAAIVVQFVLPSRLPELTTPFGVGLLLRVHRWLGVIVLWLVAVHVAVFVLHETHYVSWLYPVRGPLRAQAGWVAAASLLLITATSLWRSVLRIRYEPWRRLHAVLGALALAGAGVHVLLISWYAALPALRWYVVGMLCIGAIALAYLRVIRPFLALDRPYVVTDVVPERGSAVTLRMRAAGHPGVRFEPGQFAWIRVNGSVYGTMQHPFSYASSAADPSHVSFTVRDRGDFTGSLAQGHVQPGARVVIDGPHGAYRPTLPDAGFVLFAAGVGITPAMSFVRTFAAVGDGRAVLLVYGARTWDEVTFREELQQLAAQHAWLQIVWVLSQPEPGWSGLIGRIDAAVVQRVLPADAAERNYFVCGPPAMIDGTIAALRWSGVPGDRIYADRFDSA